MSKKASWFSAAVRRVADADRLNDQFGENYQPLFFDVTDGEAVARAASKVEEWLQGRTLAGLVNNAGMAVPGPLLHVPIEELRRQLEVDVIGQMQVILAFAPLLDGAPFRLRQNSRAAVDPLLISTASWRAMRHRLRNRVVSKIREVIQWPLTVLKSLSPRLARLVM